MPSHRSALPIAFALGALVVLTACETTTLTENGAAPVASVPASALAAVTCNASVKTLQVRCNRPVMGASGVLIGGQGVNVQLTSSNLQYSSDTGLFSFDVTVQNLMNEAIGTPDGTFADPQGIQVFIASGPSVTSGTGEILVLNADGLDTFTGGNQPYFTYSGILAKDAVSSSKPWQFQVPSTVETFSFVVYLETDVQYLLVINEVMANPSGPTTVDTDLEWFEIYNAGTRKVNLQGLVIADSAASGRRPYHQIVSSLEVPSGGYVVLGASTNTTLNGGVPVDYSYGGALVFANSLDAVKIARVYGGSDTLTVDRTQYASAAVSAQSGISRELINPALDNSNMDGSNWANALVTAVYGTGGRGTPKAQNSTFTP
jgi:hypothetical protein